MIMRLKTLTLIMAVVIGFICNAQSPQSSNERENTDRNFAEIYKAAEQGDAEAQYNLGLFYYKGNGVAQNYAEAVKWWEKAAKQEYAKAQWSLGDCYFLGKGVTQNYTQAIYWQQKAAEQGDANAQCNLGFCYAYGKGVAQDYTEAVKWYRKAAEQGYNKAIEALQLTEN